MADLLAVTRDGCPRCGAPCDAAGCECLPPCFEGQVTLHPPEDRSDLLAMGNWVADCLDERDQLVYRTVVRRLVAEVESLRARLMFDDDAAALRRLVAAVRRSWLGDVDGDLLDALTEAESRGGSR